MKSMKWWFSALLTVVIVLGAAGLAPMPAQARDPKEREEEPPVPHSLTLAPVTDENPVGSIHTVVATVRDRDGDPLEGVEVSLVVRGPCGVITPRPVTTNRRGKAEFSWTRTCEGEDTIVAFADGLTARATKRWFVPVPDPVVTSLTPDRIFLESSLPPAERLPVILRDADGDGETIGVDLYFSGRNLPVDPAAFTFSPAHGITGVHVWRLDEENIVFRLAVGRNVPLGRKELLIAPEGAARMVSTGLYLHVYRSFPAETQREKEGRHLRWKWDGYRRPKDQAGWAELRPPEFSKDDWVAEGRRRQAYWAIWIMSELGVLPPRPRDRLDDGTYERDLVSGLRTALEYRARGKVKLPIPPGIFPVLLELYRVLPSFFDPAAGPGQVRLWNKLVARGFTDLEAWEIITMIQQVHAVLGPVLGQ